MKLLAFCFALVLFLGGVVLAAGAAGSLTPEGDNSGGALMGLTVFTK